jgi:hypothetical protein
VSTSSPPVGPGSGGSQPSPLQPLRAVLIVLVAVIVGVVVLARMSASPTVAASKHPTVPSTTSTTARLPTSTTVAPVTTTSTTAAPAGVTVLVLNGYTTYHAALYFKNQLAALGYDALAPNNAITDTNKTSTIFVVAPAYRPNALALARSPLGLPASAVVSPTPANDGAVPAAFLHQADLILLVGGDLSSRVPAHYNG